MSNQFYIQRGDKSFGPYTSAQLKSLTQEGKLLRDDVVRDAALGKSATAGSIAGLFQPEANAPTPPSPQSVVQATIVEDNSSKPRQGLYCRTCGKEVNEYAVACPGCGAAPLTGSQFCQSCGAQTLPAAVMCVKCGSSLVQGSVGKRSFTLFHSWPVVAVTLLFCFPLGFVLVWSHPRWSRPRKVLWSGAWMLLLVLGIVLRHHEENEVRQIIAEAHQSWTEGKKSEAVSRYRAAIKRGVDLIDEKDRSLVLSRMVDYAAENGNVEEAKALLQRYSDEGIVPESAAGQGIIAQIREEQRREREQQEREKEKAQAEAKKLSREGGFPSLLGMLDELGLGKELTFGTSQIYYKSPVTEQEARRLGEFFVAIEFFNDTEKTVQVTKSNYTYELRMPIKKGVEQDQAIVESLRLIGAYAAESVFGSAHLDIHLCDDSLETIRVVPCN